MMDAFNMLYVKILELIPNDTPLRLISVLILPFTEIAKAEILIKYFRFCLKTETSL